MHKSSRSESLDDIPFRGVCLDTPVSEFLQNIYARNPPPLPVLSLYQELPLWELFDAINAGADELKLPDRIVKTERYKVLKGLYDDLEVLRDNEVWSPSDWTIEKREAVISLTNEDGTKKVSRSTIALLEDIRNLNKDDGPLSARKGLLSLSYVGENNYLVYVAGPLVDRILKVMEEKMASHTKEVQNVTSYMNAPVPSAYDDTRPDIMLTTLKRMHFVSVKVKADSSQLALAFDEALKAGFFLTPLTGYSAIIMAVAGTKVLMGLHTLLPHPTDIEETSSAASRGPRVWMQSASQALTAMDATLKGELNLLPFDERHMKLNILRGYASIVYPCSLDFNLIKDRSTFDTVLKKYLQYLVDPICFGVLSNAASGAIFLEKSNNRCRVVMCDRPLFDRYRLPGCSERFVAKLCVVRDMMSLRAAHAVFDCEIHRETFHWFKSSEHVEGIEPSESNDIERKGDKGMVLATCVYRQLKGVDLNSVPSAVQVAKLMGILIVLHDKMKIYHCNVRRPNIIINRDSVRLIDYKYTMMKRRLSSDGVRAVPDFMFNFCTVHFLSRSVLQEDPRCVCSFTKDRYVQLLDICSLFYFVIGVSSVTTHYGDTYVGMENCECGLLSMNFHTHFCRVVRAEKRLETGRTTAAILQDVLSCELFSSLRSSMESTFLMDAKSIAERHNWFADYTCYKDLCDCSL